jgi:hypothetical protein
MAILVNKHLLPALTIIDKPDGKYLITKTMADLFIETCEITKDEIKGLAKLMPIEGYVITNPFYLTLLVYILTFITVKKEDMASSTSKLYACFTLSYLKAKYIPVCDEDAMMYTLANLHGSSVARKGFRELTSKVSDETFAKYLPFFQTKIDIYYYYRFIVDIRNKLNQSMKLIAHKYYYFKTERGTGDMWELADTIFSSNYKILYNMDIIMYLSNTTSVSVSQIEKIIQRIEYDNDLQDIVKELIARILTIWNNNIEQISEIPIRSLILKLKKNQSYLETIRKLIDENPEFDDPDMIDLITSISIVLITSYRK